MTDEEKRLRARAAEKRYRDRNRKAWLGRRAKFREKNRERLRAEASAYTAANREVIRERRKTHVPRPSGEARSHYLRHYAYRMLERARQRSKERGLEINITLEDIVIPEICPVLDIPMSPNEKVPGPRSPSLDRIDNARGYVKGNVAVISMKANLIKRNSSAAELRAVLDYIERETKSQ
jgi:hypothetical protein